MCALAGDQPDRIPFCEGNVAQKVAKAIANTQEEMSEREISDMLARDVVVPILYPPYFADQGIGEDGAHYVTTGWIKTRADLDKMVFPDPNDEALYANAREVLEDKGEYAAAAAVKLGAAPTLMSMGLDGFSYALLDDPGLIHEVLERYVDWQVVVSQNLIEMGYDFLWCFDDIAYKSGPFFSVDVFREYFLPAMQRSSEAITVPWVYHSDGNIMSLMEDLLSLGMDAIHPLEPGPMDLAEVKEMYGKRVALIGNVSVDALSVANPEEIDEIVRQCIEVAGPGGGYMVSSSNSVPSYANPDNVVAMAQAIQKYGRY
jgi:uroporphyrinogen decarboxylase